MEDKNKTKENISLSKVPWWAKSVLLLILTVVVSYKIIETPFNFSFDFPSFLALLLALFSVGLAALFYFKATETSNSFYDNTYKFTQEIAGLLVKIESGFGEKLRHLDETYKNMQASFDKLPGRLNIKDTEKELKKEEQELQNIIQQKEKMIQELVSKSQLREEEKENFLAELNQKEEALNEARSEVNFLRHRLNRAENIQSNLFSLNDMNNETLHFLRNIVLEHIGLGRLREGSISSINRRFRSISEELPRHIILELQKNRIIDEVGNLTEYGINFLRKLSFEINA